MAKNPDLAMFLAAVNGDAPGVRAALAAGANPNKWEDASKISPLSWAVRMGSAECVDVLLAAGANPWISGAGSIQSAIGYAMEYERWDLLGRLIDGCADPEMKTEHRLKDAWKTAVVFGHVQALGALLRAGVDIEEPFAHSGATPLASAAYDRREETLRALLALGADPDAAAGRGGAESSPALRAIQAGWSRGLEVLLEAGASCDGPQGPGSLAKAVAMGNGDPEAAMRMLGALQAAGADLLRPGFASDLLAAAAEHGDVGSIRWLCERGVDPATPRIRGPSALDWARLDPDKPSSSLLEAYALSAHERRELSEQAAAPKPASKKSRM